MHLPHHGADESLDMSAVMRRSDGPIVDRDTVLLASTPQRLAVEVLAIVEMQMGQ